MRFCVFCGEQRAILNAAKRRNNRNTAIRGFALQRSFEWQLDTEKCLVWFAWMKS
jgi:hypothetical protein